MTDKKATLFFFIAALAVAGAFAFVYKKINVDHYQMPLGSDKYQVVYVAESPEYQARLADIYIKFFSGVVVSVSALLAALSYFRNARLERAKWLGQLHEKFFERPTYNKIRQALDYNKVPNADYVKLKAAIENETDDHESLQEEFVNYVNLFEYVATLWKNNQLKTSEVYMLFGYYLTNLERHNWVMKFAGEKQFKNLPDLIAAVKNVKGKA